MIDREKVIKDLEFCVNGHFKVELSLATKILALLKEQEPIKPEMFDVGDGWIDYYCGNCKRELLSFNKSLNIELPKYCNHCGQAVKWDE